MTEEKMMYLTIRHWESIISRLSEKGAIEIASAHLIEKKRALRKLIREGSDKKATDLSDMRRRGE